MERKASSFNEMDTTKKRLTELAPRMQTIIDEQLVKAIDENEGQVPSLESFFVSLHHGPKYALGF